MVSGVLRHSGGIRVDHIIGLFRLWWVPEGLSPKEGTYVRYDHQALIGILALEAQRAGALVIGEDLGTVEPWVREYLTRRGILGTSVPRPLDLQRQGALARKLQADGSTVGDYRFNRIEQSVLPNTLRLRDDVIDADPLTGGGMRDAVLANAPAAEHGFFGVPKVIE